LIVARHCAHVQRPHFPLLSQVDCCIFTPIAAGGGSRGIICPSYSADSPNSPSSTL
jgi:hypothetical protein